MAYDAIGAEAPRNRGSVRLQFSRLMEESLEGCRSASFSPGFLTTDREGRDFSPAIAGHSLLLPGLAPRPSGHLTKTMESDKKSGLAGNPFRFNRGRQDAGATKGIASTSSSAC